MVLAQLQNQFFLEHLPVAAYVPTWKKKNERNEIVCFYCTQSDILLCGIARFSRGSKNKLRTFQPQKWKTVKNSQPQRKFTGSYKTKRVYTSKTQEECLYKTQEQCFDYYFEGAFVCWEILLEKHLNLCFF